MSWLFGSKPKTPQDEINAIQTDHLPDALKPTPPSLPAVAKDLQAQLKANKGENADPVRYAGYDFKSLERAASAAKQLDGSRHVQEAIQMAQDEEKTKQLEIQSSIETHKLAIKRAEGEKLRIKGEEDRKTQSESMQLRKEQAKFEDRLARQRDQDKLEAERKTQQDILAAQESSLKKQEDMRRATLEHEMQLRRDADIAKAEAEARAKAKIDRENHDIRMKEIRLEAQEKGKVMKEKTKQWIQASREFLSANLGTPQGVAQTCLVTGALVGSFYGVKHISTLGLNFAQARLMQPILVRETNRPKIYQKIAAVPKSFFSKTQSGTSFLSEVVVSPKVNESIVDIALGAQQTIQNNGYLRNVLLYGPPGTGKTLFARKLAQHSNMKYAIISGGDVAPLGGQAVTEIHKLWSWAETENSGVILFIDEADAFLQKRNDKHGKMSESMRATVNAFLMKTGTESKKIMVVMASNQPEQLDWAINDRIDTSVYFPLPTEDERVRLVNLYYNKHILEGACNPDKDTGFIQKWYARLFKSQRRLSPDENLLKNQTEILTTIAKKTEGLSGRQISKMVTAWEHALYAAEDGILTKEMLDKGVEKSLADNKQRLKWLDDEEASARQSF